MPEPTHPTTTPRDLLVMLESFEIALEAARRSPRTIAHYSDSAHQLHAWLVANQRSTSIDDIDRDTIRRFLIDHSNRTKPNGKKLSPSTVRSRYAGLVQVFRFLVEDGELTASPLTGVAKPQLPTTILPVLSDDQLKRLLATMSGVTFLDRRDTAIVRVLLDTGIRRAELTGLRWTPETPETNDVDIRDGCLRIRGKGDRERLVYPNAKTRLALDRYRRVRASHPHAASPWFWLSQRERLTDEGVAQMLHRRGLATSPPIDHLRPHMFRSTFASSWLSGGGQESTLMQVAGWRSAQMVRRYGQADQETRAGQEARRLRVGDRV